MHLLFETVWDWSVSDPAPALTDLAGQLGLDTDTFGACLGDERVMERVQSDVDDGSPYVRGAPVFVVLYNGRGRIIQGAQPAEQFKGALQEILDETAGS